MIGYNVSEMINEWGAYAGVLPQTADPQSQEVSVHKESLQIAEENGKVLGINQT